METMKSGKMIITSIPISLEQILMKLIAIKITVEKVNSNIMTVDKKILMVSKWKKLTLTKINKLINILRINKIFKINNKINNFFSLSNWMIKNQVTGVIQMFNSKKMKFLLMPEPDLQTNIPILHNSKFNPKTNFKMKKIRLILKILKEIKMNLLSNKTKKHKIFKFKMTLKVLMRLPVIQLNSFSNLVNLFSFQNNFLEFKQFIMSQKLSLLEPNQQEQIIYLL